MPSVEELLSVAEVIADTRNTMDNRIEIDADTRIIQMMPQDELFGVESDEKSERKYFKVPKIVGNGVDLSKLQLRINYQNASKMPSGKDMYIVKDATVYNDEWVYFSWELSRKVTLYKGSIYFIVCAVKADSKGNITNEWNTTLAEGKVLEGLEVETSQEQQYQASDYLEQLKQQLLEYSKEIKDTFPSDYTETVENVKNLQSDVKKLDANKITKFYTSNNGDTVLNDSDDGKIQDLMIYGKSEQAQYTGKNLLNYEKWKTVSMRNGTAVFENNGVTITAESEDAYTDYTSENAKIPVTAGKTYVLSWKSGQYEYGRVMILPKGSAINAVDVYGGKQAKYTATVGIDYITFRFGVITQGKTVSFKNIMFEEGSERTDYEPYTGGKPSPSPEYPQEIKAVVNPVIKTHGKNLLKATLQTITQNGVTCTNNGDGTYTLNGTATEMVDVILSANFHIENGKLYRMTGWDKKISGFIYLINGKDTVMDTGNGVTFTYNDATNDSKFIHIQVSKGAIINNVIIKPMICTDTTATYDDFKPYQETQATLPYELYAIPVSSGGNVTIGGQQYIADYVDVERGKFVKCISSKTINGTEIYIHIEGWNDNAFVIYDILKDGVSYQNYTDIADIITDKLVKKAAAEIADNGVIGIGSTGRGLYICLGDRYNTIEKIKEYFSSNKTVVYYVLEVPTEINLTLEQITVFKALSTYYQKTYINAESEQLEAYTMFNYPVSMEKGWEYVKQQIGDTRKYVYDMDTKLTETEASTLEAKIDTAILSEMIGG